MKLRSLLRYFAFSALVACVPVLVSPKRPQHVVQQIVYVVHADESFTVRERGLILDAAANLRKQTDGFVDIDVVFDVDFNSVTSLHDHEHDDLLLRIDSARVPPAKRATEVTLGYTHVYMADLEFTRPSQAYIVYDRLGRDDVMIHVVMHEMLHMIRNDHVLKNSQSILYPTTPADDASTCISDEDAKEICFVHGCDVHRMRTCS